MKTIAPVYLALSISAGVMLHSPSIQAGDAETVRFGEGALAYAAGSLQKSTPREGIVNLITGDNQSTGDRMILGLNDALYLKLANPQSAAVGDLYTVYRRVRKTFHPVTQEYLGFVTIRLAVVKVTQVDHALTTVEVVRSYGPIAPGDPVMRFEPPTAAEEASPVVDAGELRGMIVELQSDKTMTLVAQSDVAYLDRGKGDGLRRGDVLDLYRQGQGLPSRKIGQLRVISTEDRTATASILGVTTRVMKGDRFKRTAHQTPIVLPADPTPVQPLSQPKSTQTEKSVAAVPTDLVARKLAVQDAAGQSRMNLGDMANFLRYDSGEAAIRPEGYKVLDQLIEYLRTSGDARMIRVEGHADNVEIGPSLKSRYPSNWELSKARASGVVRYLVEKGGLDSARLTSVGYGDSRPAATNANEGGRTSNRRVEILLYAPSTTDTALAESPSPKTAGTPENDPASLSAKGANVTESTPAGQDIPPSPTVGDGAGQSSLPPVDGPGTLSVPDSAGISDSGNPPAQDAPKPVRPPLE